jgi:hypothetical protein
VDIRPVRDDTPPERPAVPTDIRARAHQIRAAAEVIAGHRERLRGEGLDYELVVERLQRADTHLVWVLEQLEAVAGELEERGWVPPPVPPPSQVDPWGAHPMGRGGG